MKSSIRLIAPIWAVAALALAGCATTSDAAASGAESEASATDGTGGVCDVTVVEGAQSLDTSAEDLPASENALHEVGLSADVAAAPTMTYEAPLAVTAESVLLTDEGSGEAISEGQVITFNYMVCDLITGEKVFSTWGETADTDTPATYSLSESNFGQTFVDSLSGASVGSRFLWGQPGYSEDESYMGAASNGYVYVVNVTDARTVPDSASGADVKVDDDTLPAVDFTGGTPALTIPDSFSEPNKLVVQPLIEGDGAIVEAGQTIAVKYSGWLTDGTQFDSTWDESGNSEPVLFQIGTGQVITGWDEGLVGQKIGSRVLLVIPADMAYGEYGSGSVPADSTLIFVVDILEAL